MYLVAGSVCGHCGHLDFLRRFLAEVLLRILWKMKSQQRLKPSSHAIGLVIAFTTFQEITEYP